MRAAEQRAADAGRSRSFKPRRPAASLCVLMVRVARLEAILFGPANISGDFELLRDSPLKLVSAVHFTSTGDGDRYSMLGWHCCHLYRERL